MVGSDWVTRGQMDHGRRAGLWDGAVRLVMRVWRGTNDRGRLAARGASSNSQSLAMVTQPGANSSASAGRARHTLYVIIGYPGNRYNHRLWVHSCIHL